MSFVSEITRRPGRKKIFFALVVCAGGGVLLSAALLRALPSALRPERQVETGQIVPDIADEEKGMDPASLSEQENPALPWDGKSALVLSWIGIGENAALLRDSTGFELFREQIDALQDGGRVVLSLESLIRGAFSESSNPPPAAALSFDEGRRSILDRAVPFLIEHDLPFTVFFAPDRVDRREAGFLNWDELRALSKKPGATLGIHPAMASESGKPEDMLRRINAARVRFREELGSEPRLLAWPNGDYNRKDLELAERQGFQAAFGRQSGIMGKESNRFALPRFAMAEDYGDARRFRTIISALPLPMRDIEPEDTYLDPPENPPSAGFSVPPELRSALKDLSCFASGQGRVRTQIVGEDRVELRFSEAFEPGTRIRVDCTMPSGQEDEEGDPRRRWGGFLFSVPEAREYPPTPPGPDEPP